MEEIWKNIPGYEGLYQVNNFGKVKSLAYKTQNPVSKTKFIYRPERILCDRIRGDGRKFVSLGKKGNKNIIKRYSISRLVARVFKGLDIDDTKICVCHKDDNITNDCEDNLFIGTQKDNLYDMMDKGRQNFFGGKIQKKISNNQIQEIKLLYKRGISKKEKIDIAKKYGISLGCVKNIMYGTNKYYNFILGVI